MLKSKIVRDTSFTTIASYLTRFIGLVRGFIVAKLLDPSLYGYFSGLSLIFLYNSQAHLGILHGLNRNLSITKGAGEVGLYDDVKNNGISAIIFLSVIFAALIFTYSFIADHSYSVELKWGIRVYAVLSVMFHMEYVSHSLLRVEHRFREIVLSKLLFSSTNLLFMMVLAYYFRFYGVLIAFLVSLFLQNLYLFFVTKVNLKLSFNLSVIKMLFFTGAPIAFSFLIDIILNTIDRLMIAAFLTSSELGFYGIGLTFSSELILQLPNTISYVVFPRLLEKYGKYKNYNCLFSLFKASTIAIALFMALVIGILFVSIDYLIIYLLPRYVEAIDVVRILVFSSYFISINQIAVRILITTGETRKLIVFQIVAIVTNFILNYFGIKSGFGINGIAVATGVSYFIYSVCVTHYTLEKFHKRFIFSLKEQIVLYIPLFYICLMLIMISQFSIIETTVTGNIKTDVYACSIKILFLLIMYSPVILFNCKKLKLQL